jgi:hypothetical protein
VNIALWVLQVLLALHTAMGAAWKWSNSEQTVPSLSALPHGAWLAMSVLELACVVGLLVPAVSKRLGRLAPIAAVVIGAEMLVFCVIFLTAGARTYGEVVYWLVVAAFCAFLAYGRLVLKPIKA